ncbi:MAG: hypothetical protein P8103_06965 [Candidatus Thiodiazotropha sp.]|jgi:hypothetical protein
MHKLVIDNLCLIGRRSEESLLSHPGLLPEEWLSVASDGVRQADETSVAENRQQVEKAYAHFLYALLIG